MDRHKILPEQIKRFWTKVDKNPGLGPRGDCWEWIAGKKGDAKSPYGGFYLKQINNTVNSHQLCFCIIHNFDIGEIPEGIVIRHLCNNHKCVRPDHLALGTFKNNSEDMVAAGNSMRGFKNGKRKITLELANEIRELWKTKTISQNALAKKFDLAPTTIKNILLNKFCPDSNYDVSEFLKNPNYRITKYDPATVELAKKLHAEKVPTGEILKRCNMKISQFYNIVKNRQRKEGM